MKVHKLEKTIFGILVVLFAGAGIFFWAEYPNIKKAQDEQNAPTPTPTVQTGMLKNTSGTLEVTAPQMNQEIKSPFLVTGRAKGMWFFEASFPIKVLDQDGTVLGQGVATAQGNWMTEDFVEFKAIIEFKTPQGKTGNLVLKKDNSSGLPQNDESFIIPISFSKN